MKDILPPEIWQPIVNGLSAIGAAILGRLVWHVRQAQKAERKFISIHLVFELIIAVGIGLVADGALEYYGLTGSPKTAGTIVLAYLGPGGIEFIIRRYLAGRAS